MSQPRILTLDIETSPNKVWTWGLWNQNVYIDQIIEPTRMLCFAAKWLDKPKVLYYDERGGHTEMVEQAYRLLDEADALVTYNGDNFDIPHLRREFLECGLGQPSSFASVDLFKVSKKTRFPSHKLAYITRQLNLTGKLPNGGFQLWLDVLAGDVRAWNLMRRYNKRDVITTEELYHVLLELTTTVPNYNLTDETGMNVCPKCGSEAIYKNGVRYARSRAYQRYRCSSCGSGSVTGHSIKSVELR